MNQEKKRPPKQECVTFISSIYTAVNNIPTFTPEIAKAQLEMKNYFLYQDEVEEIIKAKAEDPEFNADKFLNFLLEVDAYTDAKRLPFGGKHGAPGERINSRERALQVANDPSNEEHVAKIQELVSNCLALRKELMPLISKKANLSIALKNAVPKKRKPKEAPKEVPEAPLPN